MKITKLELVRGIQALIAEEKHWCRVAVARDEQGNAIHPGEPNAVSFCIYGAGRRVSGMDGFGKLETGGAFWDVMSDIGRCSGPKLTTIGAFNDSHTHAEVMERLKEVEVAYAAEEAQPKEIST
jgi:hypothetical protein